MANKLKTKPANTKRYLKGLSLNEMDDVEESVESALENPGGTFVMVSREHSFKLSALSKTVKSISGDTKHIRKKVDSFEKKLDDFIADGSGSGTSFGLPDVLRRNKPGGGPRGRSNGRKPGKIGKLGMLGRVAGPAAVAYGITKVLADLDTNEDGSTNVGEWFNENVFDLDGKMFEWTGSGIDRKKNPLKNQKQKATEKNSVLNRISFQQNNITQAMPQRGIPELTPSQRAIIIRERLKGMSQIPGMQTGGMAADGMQYAPGIPNARGTLAQGFPGKGGGFKSNYLESGRDASNPSAAPAGIPPVAGAPATGPTGKPGDYRPVYDLSEADLSDDVINTIAGEARLGDQKSVDAVINNILNRVGSPDYNGKNMQTVAMQTGYDKNLGRQARQYIGYRKPTAEQAEMIRQRIKTIASGSEPDITGGANEYRADSYLRSSGAGKTFDKLAQKQGYKNLGGNVYADTGYRKGATAAYTEEQRIAMGKTTGKSQVQTAQGPDSRSIGPVAVVENQERDAKTRKKPIQPQLTAVLDYAAKQAGVDKVEVFSGGQAGIGEGGPRTGSTRHDHGNAGDIYLWKDGKKVNMNTADGREIMKKFAVASRQAGATGIGAGVGYMGPEAMHVGFGKEATWGGADWVADAAAQGKALPPVNAMALMEQNKNAAETVTASNNTPIPRALMRNKPVPATGLGLADMSGTNKYAEWRAEKDKETESPTKNRDEHFAKIDAAIAKQKEEKRLASIPLTPGADGKADFDRRTPQERLQADKSTDGLSERAAAYAMYDDIKNPPRAFPNRQAAQPLPEYIARPIAASVAPEPNNIMQAAQDMAQSAMETAQNATKSVYDWMAGQKAVAPPAANRIPQVSKNPPPLRTPPRTFHKATGTTNPTAQSPGSDSSKSFGLAVEDPSLWQYPAEMMSP